MGALAFSIALVLLALVPLAQAKEVFNFFGNEAGINFGNPAGIGNLGGGFGGNPRGVAVNDTGIGAPAGTIYVVDGSSNNLFESNSRIQRFDKNFKFVSAWGKNVIASSVDERQRLQVIASGGSFTLSFDGSTTAPIPYGASPDALDDALDALFSIGDDANVAVGGGPQFSAPNTPYFITFRGALAATDLPQITVGTSKLEGTANVSVLADGLASVPEDSGTGFEVCTIAAHCKPGVASGGTDAADNGSLSAPQAVAVDGDTGNVYVSDRASRRVNAYSAGGDFIAAYGWNVVASGPDNAAEFQRVTVDATGGTFTLSFGANAPTTTAPLDFDATAAEVQSALEVLGDIGAGNILVTKPDNGPYVVRFVGALGNANQPLLTTDPTLLSGDDPDITGTGPSATATEVVAGGQANNYEICNGAVDSCQAGSGGAGAGQVGLAGEFANLGIAVSRPDSNPVTGSVFLADSGNRRVATYSLDGTSFSSFGTAGSAAKTFGTSGSGPFVTGWPQHVAVDSRGIVYASNSNLGGEIERYDTRGANGPVDFLDPIPSGVAEVQTIHINGFSIEGSTYTLTCPTGGSTEPIPADGNSGENEQAAEAALDEACGAESFSADSVGTDIRVTFGGDFAGVDVPQTACTKVSGPVQFSCSASTNVNGQAGALLAGNTIDLAIAADSDGDPDGGPDRDSLYVFRRPTIGNLVIQQFDDSGLVAAPSTESARHGAGFPPFFSIGGFGLDDSSGRLLVSSTVGIGGLASASRVYVLGDPLSAPSIALDPVSAKTDTTATFSATVDPKGGQVKCTFQYATEPGFSSPATTTDVTVPVCPSLGANGGFQPVSQAALGLQPNTLYYLRLRVARAFDPNAVVTSAPISFTTDAPPPVISNTGAVDVADASVRLVTTIDPRNNATGYVFEYGTTPALGSATAPLQIGGGNTPITVSQVVSGLAKDTEYYFRAVATNAVGTTQGQIATFHTRATALPSSGNRAFEQVTPPDKNYGPADSGIEGYFTAGASLDGNAVGLCPMALFGEPPGRLTDFCSPYISRRTDSGWVTPNNYPPFCYIDPATGQERFGGRTLVPSADYSRVLVRLTESEGCPSSPLLPAAQVSTQGTLNFYMQDSGSPPFSSPSYSLLNPESGSPEFEGGSDDFSHLVYRSSAAQTLDAPGGSFNKLYEWVEEGPDCASSDPSYDASLGACLALISKAPDNTPFTTMSAAPAMSSAGLAIMAPTGIASDGERAYFANSSQGASAFNTGFGPGASCLGPACQIYLREHGQRADSPRDVNGNCTDASLACTFDVSASECSTACGNPQAKADMFLAATPSGRHAFFTSCAKLTDESAPEAGCTAPLATESAAVEGSRLYRWDRDASPGHRLVEVTLDREPIDAGSFKGLIGASEDGNTAYFVGSGGQLAAGGPTTPGLKLYRWHYDEAQATASLEYIAPYERLDGYVFGDVNWNRLSRTVSADGKYLQLYTRLGYVAGDVDGDTDVYRWGEEEGWICASCQAPGAPSGGDVDQWEVGLPYQISTNIAAIGNADDKLSMSADGQRIFFGTPDALVPQDTNGANGCPFTVVSVDNGGAYPCEDVYEWHDGTVSLVSSGTSPDASRLIGTTPSGRDIFFFTTDRLVGWDFDNAADIYDARIGGGFPEPPAQPPSCEGEACRGAGTSAPEVAGAGTAVFQGPGNPAPKHAKAGKKKKRKKGSKKKSSKRGKASRHKRTANHDRRAAR